MGSLIDGTKFESTRDRDEPVIINLGKGAFFGLLLFMLVCSDFLFSWVCCVFSNLILLISLIGEVVSGLDQAIVTMKKGEVALFTMPAELGYGVGGLEGVVPPNSVVQFEVELISWITVVDVCKDCGIIKKIMEKGARNQLPGELDEVLGIFITVFAIDLFAFCLSCSPFLMLLRFSLLPMVLSMQ